MKYYLFTMYYDDGHIKGYIKAQDEMNSDDWGLADNWYTDFDNYDLYVDEYNSMDEAIKALEEAINA